MNDYKEMWRTLKQRVTNNLDLCTPEIMGSRAEAICSESNFKEVLDIMNVIEMQANAKKVVIKYESEGIYSGSITWSASENFFELLNRRFDLCRTNAEDIYAMLALSDKAKILLSAVAGAVIQHLLDKGISFDKINMGSFYIQYE